MDKMMNIEAKCHWQPPPHQQQQQQQLKQTLQHADAEPVKLRGRCARD